MATVLGVIPIITQWFGMCLVPEVRTLSNTLVLLLSTPLLGNSVTLTLRTNVKFICMYKLLSTL